MESCLAESLKGYTSRCNRFYNHNTKEFVYSKGACDDLMAVQWVYHNSVNKYSDLQ